MDSMIKVEDVSMKFNLGIEKNFSLKLFFINMFKPKKKDEKKGNKDFWALKHVNFEVERGEVVGFVGGCDSSTAFCRNQRRKDHCSGKYLSYDRAGSRI